MNMNEFAKYCFDFYGDKGIYPIGATMETITKAIAKLIEMRANDPEAIPFEGDSVDRECVRDIILAGV